MIETRALARADVVAFVCRTGPPAGRAPVTGVASIERLARSARNWGIPGRRSARAAPGPVEPRHGPHPGGLSIVSGRRHLRSHSPPAAWEGRPLPLQGVIAPSVGRACPRRRFASDNGVSRPLDLPGPHRRGKSERRSLVPIVHRVGERRGGMGFRPVSPGAWRPRRHSGKEAFTPAAGREVDAGRLASLTEAGAPTSGARVRLDVPRRVTGSWRSS